MIDIEKLLELEKKATPGPWAYDMGNWEVEKKDGRNPVCETNNLGDDNHPRIGYSHHDGEFIAAMRNVILPLIKELKAARKVVEAARYIEGNLGHWFLNPHGASELKEAMYRQQCAIKKLDEVTNGDT